MELTKAADALAIIDEMAMAISGECGDLYEVHGHANITVVVIPQQVLCRDDDEWPDNDDHLLDYVLGEMEAHAHRLLDVIKATRKEAGINGPDGKCGREIGVD